MESGRRRRLPGRGETPARRSAWAIKLVAILAVGALVLSQCGGDDEEPADGDETTGTTAEATTGTTATTVFAAPPAPEPLSPPGAAPAPQPPAAQPAAPAPPPPPALSGPPPVTVGVMSDMAIAADGYAHARFVATFFDGPVASYSAVSADGSVATAGVSPPDMLIVAPVSNGTTSITVTASGPGGTATQTFVARVGVGPEQVDRPAAAPAPAPAPPPPPPAPDESDVLLPVDDLPPTVPDESTTATTQAGTEAEVSSEPLPPPVAATEPPSLSGSVAEQIIFAGQSRTVDINPYFTGVVQGWAVESSNPNHVAASMTVAGEVVVRGVTEGISTVTVTATNDRGSVAQAFRVAVRRGTGATGGGTTPTVESVGDAPEFSVVIGRSIRVDLSEHFSEGATGFDVSYDVNSTNGRIDASVRGSVATIRGVEAGKIVVIFEATDANRRVTQLVVVEVVPL